MFKEGEIGFDALEDMEERDRQLLLSPQENTVIGSSVKIGLGGKELKLVDDQTQNLEGDSIRMGEAYSSDRHAVITPKGIQSKDVNSIREVAARRLGKKVDGLLVMFGPEAALVTFQGIETGIIPCDLNDAGEAENIRVYLARDGKLIMPDAIGADKWSLTETHEQLLEYVETEPEGTMLFRNIPKQ